MVCTDDLNEDTVLGACCDVESPQSVGAYYMGVGSKGVESQVPWGDVLVCDCLGRRLGHQLILDPFLYGHQLCPFGGPTTNKNINTCTFIC